MRLPLGLRKGHHTTPPKELQRAQKRVAELQRTVELLETEYRLQTARDTKKPREPHTRR